jgi:hypothetical protein
VKILIDNWQITLAAIILIVWTVYLAITKQWTRLRETAYQLMLSAEKVMSTEDGQAKMDTVLEVFYNFVIPKLARSVYTKEQVRAQLQAWYNKAKDWLDDGIINDT